MFQRLVWTRRPGSTPAGSLSRFDGRFEAPRLAVHGGRPGTTRARRARRACSRPSRSPSPSPAAHRYAVTGAAAGGRSATWRSTAEPVVVGRPVRVGRRSLVHDLNRRRSNASPYLALHAGGVEIDGVTVVLPGHMEAGKTTLTTGLVRAGRPLPERRGGGARVGRAGGRAYPIQSAVGRWPGRRLRFPSSDPPPGSARRCVATSGTSPRADPSRPVGRGGGCDLLVFPAVRGGAGDRRRAGAGREGWSSWRRTRSVNESGVRRALDHLATLLAGAPRCTGWCRAT